MSPATPPAAVEPLETGDRGRRAPAITGLTRTLDEGDHAEAELDGRSVVTAAKARLRRHRVDSVAHEAEFSELFRALYPQAYRVAYRLLGSAEAAEDAAAEAFARTFAAWERVRELPHREAWVIKTTGNVALNVLARKKPDVRPARASADEDATATRLALVCALGALSRRQQEAIVLHHLAGLTEAEVADALGVAPSTVKTHLKRGMALLRDDLVGSEGSDVA